ncbi:MAG: efflux transporter outer membrane subunit [Planctomycetota bacterium]|jgi:multidrug efflux system outer membrane protein
MAEPRHLCFASLCLLSGCLVGPDFEPPVVEVPDTFLETEVDGESIANIPWWELFEDETLRNLIDRALQENKDIEIALARIAEARAALGFVQTDQYPSFGINGGAVRSDPGDETDLGTTGPSNDFRGGADAFFELDLWGKLRRATEAARGDLLATEWAHVATAISLVAEVANTYLLLLDLDEQLVITRRTLETRQRYTRIIRDRFQGGIVARLDVHQAEIEEYQTEVGVARFQREIAQTEYALRVLLGQTPGRIPRGIALPEQIDVEIPVGLPSELLRRRPDIRVAESVAAAQTARIGVATALLFPSVSLTGTFGLASEDLDDLLTNRAKFWSVGGQFTGPLFEFGRNIRRIEVEEAITEQAVLEYERSVLQAFREVEDALASVRTYRQEYASRAKQVTAAREAARLARALYDEEFTSYLEVLDTERSLLDAELQQSTALRESLQAIVRLYKALGGGWIPAPEPVQPEEQQPDSAAAADESK